MESPAGTPADTPPPPSLARESRLPAMPNPVPQPTILPVVMIPAIVPAAIASIERAIERTVGVSVVVTSRLRHATRKGKTHDDQGRYRPPHYSAAIHRSLRSLHSLD